MVPPPLPDFTHSPPRLVPSTRPSTSGGNSAAPLSFRKQGHSPSPSVSSAIATSPSSTSLQSLNNQQQQHQQASLPQSSSSYSLSGLKSRLSTKNKGKRSFTSIGPPPIKPNASISPPTLTAPPLPRATTAPKLRTQKSVDSLMLSRNVQTRDHVYTPGIVSAGLPSLTNTTTLSSNPTSNPIIPMPTMYETIHEVAEKRINTLDYLRRASLLVDGLVNSHEGRVYWYNTIKFSKSDLATRVHTDAKKMSRRVTNYFILGQSIPSILEIGANNPLEYLKAFNQLLSEYEGFLAYHPSDGSSISTTSSRVSRVKLWGRTTTVKTRRGSSAIQGGIDGLYHSAGLDSLDKVRSGASAHLYHVNVLPSNLHSSSSAGDDSGNDEYTYLVHSSLPFEPDFYETFATLCDVLIDAYARVLSLINSPDMCGVGMGESFLKADAKIKKLVVSGVVKEFEEASRASVRAELAGLAKGVLGGMI